MARTKRSTSAYEVLVRTAKSKGATDAMVIPSSAIVVDERVRLKCMVPLCSDYGRHLMCPPNVMSPAEFARVLRLYRKALLVQVEADFDSADKAKGPLTGDLCEELERRTKADEWGVKLHRLVNELEAEAFKKGYYLATGLIGNDCTLCPECVGSASGEPCRHPFEARPSMQAMSIDVVRTCRNAGLPLALSSKSKVRWTGLVLLD